MEGRIYLSFPDLQPVFLSLSPSHKQIGAGRRIAFKREKKTLDVLDPEEIDFFSYITFLSYMNGWGYGTSVGTHVL